MPLGKEKQQRLVFMQDESRPHPESFVLALKACASSATKEDASKTWFLEKGKHIHSKAKECRLDNDMFVESTLIDMYAKCGSMDDALKVFEGASHRTNVVLWNCVILGYAECGKANSAMEIYARMRYEGILPTHVTILAALKACSKLAEVEISLFVNGKFVKVKSLETGMQVHVHARTSGDGIFKHVAVANSLVDFYAKCGSMQDARHVFEKMTRRTVISWTAMIWGYAENKDPQKALELYYDMKNQELVPDAVTYVAALKAAAAIANLETGRFIHDEILKSGLQKVPSVANVLVDFYAKCGSMVDARKAFDAAPRKCLITWGALLSGYSRQGDIGRVLEVFHKMKERKVKPDEAIFLSIITACSHAGNVEAGKLYFRVMQLEYGLTPKLGHYNCIVDLLSRDNRLEEALKMVESMPVEADEITWTILLTAARKWKNLQVGKLAFQALRKMTSSEDTTYVLMSGVYARLGIKTEKASRGWSNGMNLQPREEAQWCDNAGTVHIFCVDA